MAWLLISALFLGGCTDEQPPEPAAESAQQAAPVASEPLSPLPTDAPQSPVPPAAEVLLTEPGVPAVELLPVVIPEMPAPAAFAQPPLRVPVLSIIIDDIGQSRVAGERVIALPGQVALAIMPFTPNAQLLARLAAEAGNPVMLHLPMESMASLSMGEGGLDTQMGRSVFDARLQASLNAFSPIQGVNNHMGSKLTADRERMDWLMAQLAARQLFFVDSRTTKDTQAAFAAQALNVDSVSRDVFLDNERSTAGLEQEFKRALALARKQGSAVLIGHPYPESLSFLERRLPELEEREGVRLVSVQALLTRPH